MNSLRLYLSEFIGTFGLVFFVTGAMIFNDISGGIITHYGIALTYGFIVMAMVFSLGEVSGAHINPAVTIAFMVKRLISPVRAIFYVIFQFLGAISASATLFLLFPGHITYGETLPSMVWYKAFSLEFLMAYFLMFIINSVSTGSKISGVMAGLAIGAVIIPATLICGSLTGASLNPARSLGPAIVSFNFSFIWIYMTAPVMGAIAGALSHSLITSHRKI